MKPQGAAAPALGASPTGSGVVWGTRGLTVLLARTAEAKTRLLSSLAEGMATAAGGNGAAAAPGRAAPALVIDARDLHGAAGFADAELAAAAAAIAEPQHAAQRAIGALRAAAAALLADDGQGGRIAELAARLHDLEATIEGALGGEDSERARIAPLLAAAAKTLELERERERLLRERADWALLLRLQPEWQRLLDARGELDAMTSFEHLPNDIEQRIAELDQRDERADRNRRSARRELNRLLSERDELSSGTADLPAAAHDAIRLCAELPLYRARLLELAAVRARLADAERDSATRQARLDRGDSAEHLLAERAGSRRGDLQRWRERSRRSQAAHADADSALNAARGRVRDLCIQVSEQLAKPPADIEPAIDARWRALWKLRSQLEDIYDVQSRAEANARALAEREEAVRRIGSGRYWSPPRWLLGALTALAVLATAAWGSGVLRGRVPSIAVGGAALALIVVRVGLQMRARWVHAMTERRGERGDRLQRDMETLRRRRDSGWTRAAKLTESIRTATAQLGLPDAVTPEAVEACELELAAELRRSGANTHLTALLLDLLDAQDDEQRTAVELLGADSERRALEREWEAWRGETGFAHAVPVERLGGWLDDLDGLAAAQAAHGAAQRDLQSVEPATAAWEAEARKVLEQAGIAVRAELCGSALATELNALAAKARQQAERRSRREQLEAELPEAQRRLTEAEADVTAAHDARQAVFTATGAADAAALRVVVDRIRHWREARDRVRRLQASIDEALEGLLTAERVRSELAGGDAQHWQTSLQVCDARLGELHARLEGASRQRLAAEQCLQEARGATQVADLRLEREAVLAELSDAAREWKLRVLAAALLESSVREHELVGRRELLDAASRTLSTLTRGRYTGIAPSDPAGGLSLVDSDGHRVSIGDQLSEDVRGQLRVSLMLGRAAQLAGQGMSLPFVLDDVLDHLALDDAHLVAQEIASLARAHPVFYLTTAARRAHTLSAMPGDVAVVDVE
jgi:uncharacterized protein YhaN